MSQPRHPDGSVLPDAAVCDAHCCHPVKPASINGDAKAPDSVEIHQRRGNANSRETTKEEDEYCCLKFNSADGDDLYLVFAVATALAQRPCLPMERRAAARPTPCRAVKVCRGSSPYRSRQSWRAVPAPGAPSRSPTTRCTWNGAMTCLSP